MAFVQIRGEAHEPHFGQAEICELDVAHGGDKKAANTSQKEVMPTHFPSGSSTPGPPQGQEVGDGESQVSLVRLEVAVHNAIVVQVLER